MKNPTLTSRLALRVEGEFWNAYWAPSQTSMEGVVHLGSLRMSLASIPGCKNAFMALMQAAFAQAVKDSIGVQPSWTRPQLAPEHERSGSA